jgi:hypothetical protein
MHSITLIAITNDRPATERTWGHYTEVFPALLHTRHPQHQPDFVHTMEPGSQHRFFNAGRENAIIAAPAHTSNHGQRVAPGSEQGDPGGSAGGAAFVARGGDACQAGEPRARAAALRRQAARPHTAAAGQAEAIATLSPST